MSTAIYGLYDPRTPKVICYVGKGTEYRADYHWYGFVHYGSAVNRNVRAWFKKLRAEGVAPKWRFLEKYVRVRDWEEREIFWIAYWRKRNPDLCNISRGGNAFPKECAAIGGRIGGRKGGLIGGKICRDRKIGLFALTREQKRAIGKRLGRRFGTLSRDNKRGIHAPGMQVLGGRTMNCINKKNGTGFYDPAVGSRAGTIGNHNRWHVARSVSNPNCSLCKKETA